MTSETLLVKEAGNCSSGEKMAWTTTASKADVWTYVSLRVVIEHCILVAPERKVEKFPTHRSSTGAGEKGGEIPNTPVFHHGGGPQLKEGWGSLCSGTYSERSTFQPFLKPLVFWTYLLMVSEILHRSSLHHSMFNSTQFASERVATCWVLKHLLVLMETNPSLGTSLKFNMEHENQPLKIHVPFGNHHFQIPC